MKDVQQGDRVPLSGNRLADIAFFDGRVGI
jgi:prepilin-type processing-associated H-X9-DG protein